MQLLRNIQFITTGLKQFTTGGFKNAQAKWSQRQREVDERTLDGVTVVVTGANQGIGYQASLDLAARGATLIMVCRNKERGEAARDEIIRVTKNTNVELEEADLSSMRSIREFVDRLKAANVTVDVLVNNAGVMLPEKSTTLEGFETNFATNLLGPFYLTQQLLPQLRLTTSGNDDDDDRVGKKVIFVSSGGMLTEKLVVDKDLQCSLMNPYDGTRAYAVQKRQQVAICEHWARLEQERPREPALLSSSRNQQVTFVTCHPGWTSTEGIKNAMPSFFNAFKDKWRTLREGADTIVFLVAQDAREIVPGGFYLDRNPQKKHLTWAGTNYSAEDAERLFQKCAELCPVD